MHKVNRIIGTIAIWGEIIVLFCQWILLEKDRGGAYVNELNNRADSLYRIGTIHTINAGMSMSSCQMNWPQLS